jgi:predicted RND superfamily exporter protein
MIISRRRRVGSLGAWVAGRIHIGDTQAGVPELRQESRYNTDTRVITTRFNIGVDVLTVIVETPPNGCVDHAVVTLMDEFEGAVRAVPAVRSVVSLPAMAKIVNAGFSEGSLKWRILPATNRRSRRPCHRSKPRPGCSMATPA